MSDTEGKYDNKGRGNLRDEILPLEEDPVRLETGGIGLEESTKEGEKKDRKTRDGSTVPVPTSLVPSS